MKAHPYRTPERVAPTWRRATFLAWTAAAIASGLLIPGGTQAGARSLAPRYARTRQPLVLERSFVIPGIPVGPYSDDVEVDSDGKRIFATPQAGHAVAVLAMQSGRLLKLIKGIGNPHSLYYSGRDKHLFVVDGQSGDVKVFDGTDYALIKTIPLTVGADGLIYDSRSNLLYIANGGKGAGMERALLSIIDPVRMEKIGDIPLTSTSVEGGDIDEGRQLIYINLEKDDNAVAVVDLKGRRQKAIWKLPSGQHRGKGIAVDATHNRLYVASRDTDMHGSIIVLDATTGHHITSLPIAGWVDGISVDDKRRRIYASCGLGYIETYSIGQNDAYRRLPPVETALLAKTGMYSNEQDRFYVDVPHLGDFGNAQVMVFKPLP